MMLRTVLNLKDVCDLNFQISGQVISVSLDMIYGRQTSRTSHWSGEG